MQCHALWLANGWSGLAGQYFFLGFEWFKEVQSCLACSVHARRGRGVIESDGVAACPFTVKARVLLCVHRCKVQLSFGRAVLVSCEVERFHWVLLSSVCLAGL